MTEELSQLLKAIGGTRADLNTDANVLAKFIDLYWIDDPEFVDVLRIASEAFASRAIISTGWIQLQLT